MGSYIKLDEILTGKPRPLGRGASNPSGLTILPNLLRYETFAVAYNGCMSHALNLRQTRQSLNLGFCLKGAYKIFSVYRSKISVFNYDSIPAGYYYHVMQSGSAVQRFWHEKRFKTVIDRIKDGVKVLDIGCGPGSFLSLLGVLRSNTTATGVDIDSKQIAFARKLIHHQGLSDRIQFGIINDAFKVLPFEDKLFDVITMNEVVEHIHPFFAHRMLVEAKRVLKPVGKLLVTTPNYRSHWPLIELFLDRFSPVKYHEQHISKFTPQSFVKFIESAGFEIKAIHSVFIVAPFLAWLSFRLAEMFHQTELKTKHRVGALLIIEAVPYIF